MFFNFCPTQTSTLLVVSPPFYFAIPSMLLTGIAHGITPDAHFLYSTPLVGAEPGWCRAWHSTAEEELRLRGEFGFHILVPMVVDAERGDGEVNSLRKLRTSRSLPSNCVSAFH